MWVVCAARSVAITVFCLCEPPCTLAAQHVCFILFLIRTNLLPVMTHNRWFTLLFIALVPLSSIAQVWTDLGGFPSPTTYTEAIHGLAVDGENKVWIQPWAASLWIDTETGEPVMDAAGNEVSTHVIHVYNSDGSLAMDPIRTVTVDGLTDTLFTNLRGLRRDHNGDILLATGVGDLYRLDHKSGEGLVKQRVATGSLSTPGVDAQGNIYVANVIEGSPIRIYNADLDPSSVEIVVNYSPGFSRSFDVSADGREVYWSGYTNNAIYRYTRSAATNSFGAVPDTLLKGIVSEAIVRHPVTGHIWFSNGPASGTEPTGPWAEESALLSWVALDPASGQAYPGFRFQLDNPVEDEKARAIAFSPDGETAYAAIFDNNNNLSVKKFTATGRLSFEPDESTVPGAFSLDQNYPNPFNPSTTISFSLTKSGETRLVVHNMLGQHVATLVDGHLAAGRHHKRFVASDLGSGTYFYHLEFEGLRRSGKMLLLK